MMRRPAMDRRLERDTKLPVNNSLPIAVASIRSNFELWRKGEIKDGAFSFHLQNNLLLIEKELPPADQLVYRLNESARVIFENNKAKGFHENTLKAGELLMLVVSELGEAIEAHRASRFADLTAFESIIEKSRIINNDPTYTGDITPDKAYAAHFRTYMKDTFEDEIADAIIRLLDLAALYNIDIEKHINAKVKYNAGRPRMHGKTY